METSVDYVTGDLVTLAGNGLWCATCNAWRALIVVGQRGAVGCATCGTDLSPQTICLVSAAEVTATVPPAWDPDEGLWNLCDSEEVAALERCLQRARRASVDHDEGLGDAPYTEQITDTPTSDEMVALLHRLAASLDRLVNILSKEFGQ